jgi:hypothetical protein
MGKVKVVKAEAVIKGNERIFAPIKERVAEVVLEVMQGVKRRCRE